LRVVFAGTPPFAARALAALHGAGHEIPLVLTQPDRPAGRGMKLTASAVGAWAGDHGLAIAKPATLRNEDGLAPLIAAHADVMVVAAYGLILPARVLAIPRLGCINIHASLLPRWRGAAPIQRAILAGDAQTGISIMRMDEGLDTGPVLMERALTIAEGETAGALTERLANLGAESIVEALSRLPTLVPYAQSPADATYAAKIIKSEARIDWTRSATEIERLVRAFNPAPGAETSLGGQGLKVWSAKAVPGEGGAGQVLHFRNKQLIVACGSGALELLEIQRPGGRRMGVPDFLAGTPLDVRARLGEDLLASP
jgi:methionyl-tRNA formyltransferase